MCVLLDISVESRYLLQHFVSKMSQNIKKSAHLPSEFHTYALHSESHVQQEPSVLQQSTDDLGGMCTMFGPHAYPEERSNSSANSPITNTASSQCAQLQCGISLICCSYSSVQLKKVTVSVHALHGNNQRARHWFCINDDSWEIEPSFPHINMFWLLTKTEGVQKKLHKL